MLLVSASLRKKRRTKDKEPNTYEANQKETQKKKKKKKKIQYNTIQKI